jgi:endonuclease YncB( thermonuclease family)
MMRKIFALFAISGICYAEPTNKTNLYDWKILKYVDGDTVEVQADFLPVELGNHLLLRIYGVDTPEKGWRAQSDHERQMGEKASVFTKNLLQNAKVIKIQVICWDKYGGRLLGDVIIDDKSLRQLLLENKYAREYYGNKKESWDDYDNSK